MWMLQTVDTPEEWDERAAQLAGAEPSIDALEWHVQSVALLAALGANRSAACQIFAASHVSCRQVCLF